MTAEPPANFDWVSARHNCSAMTMLERLREQARANVDRVNELTASERFMFRQSEDIDVYRFSVIDRHSRARRAVEFDWDGSAIQITAHNAGKSLAVAFTLNDRGECKFKIGDDELDPWQVLRRALEPIFFA